jgi:hypothetical protein
LLYSVQNLLSSCLLSKNLNITTYKTTILPVALYGCETWSLILRQENRLGVFENRVPRKICASKKDELTGGWGELHNEEFHNLSSSPIIMRMTESRRMRWAGHVVRLGEKMNTGFWLESQKKRDHYEYHDRVGG